LFDLVKIIAGLALLFYGADFLVTGSTRLARFLKISPFVIGATVIAFGTSAPELAVAILAALDAAPELAMGNVIGSNIANIGLVLGITAIVAPVAIDSKRFNREYPPFLLTACLILFLAWDLRIHRLEGVIMVSLLALYVWRSFNHKENIPSKPEDEISLLTDKGPAFHLLLIVIGLIALVGGAKLLVFGGVSIARNIGISEWFIGISIVAIGTSLPEIVSSVMAARRGHGEMAVGNIFGSNIFNILMVLGITSLIHPLNISEPINPDLIIATGMTSLLLALIVFEKHSLRKISGATLLSTYFLYIILKGVGTL
jgi:cation:H+ antiporter